MVIMTVLLKDFSTKQNNFTFPQFYKNKQHIVFTTKFSLYIVHCKIMTKYKIATFFPYKWQKVAIQHYFSAFVG